MRLSQLAKKFTTYDNLFTFLIEYDTLDVFRTLNLATSYYWETHYTFGTISKKRSNTMSKSFLNRILNNSIIPLKFDPQGYEGIEDQNEMFKMLSIIKMEKIALLKILKN